MNREDFLNLKHVKALFDYRNKVDIKSDSREEVPIMVISNFLKEANIWLAFFGDKLIKSDLVNLTNLILMNYPKNTYGYEYIDTEVFNFLKKMEFYPHINTSFKYKGEMDVIDRLNILIRESKTLKGIYYNDKQLKLYDDIYMGENLVINAPTSYGKSLITLNGVIDRIKDKKIRNILYLVPTKSLINEYKHSIKKRCKESGIKEINIHETPYIDPNFDEVNFYVFTQERSLIFFNSENSKHMDIVIIDEAHNMSTLSEERTILLLKSIESFKDAQMIFLSPYVENFKSNIINNLIPNLITREETITSKDMLVSNNKFIIDLYNDERGILLSDITFIQMKTRHTYDSLVPYNHIIGDRIDDVKITPKNNFIIFLGVLTKLITFNSKNIFFVTSRNNSMLFPEIFLNKYRKTLEEDKKIYSKRLIALLRHIEVNIHEEFGLISLLKHGVSYHNSYLDSFTKRQIEKLYINGEIKFLFSTSTIAQGVNLSADNMFILMGKMRSSYKEIELPNIFGRASRLGMNSLGNLYFIKSTKNQGVYEKIFVKSEMNVDINIKSKKIEKIYNNVEFKTYLSDLSINNEFKNKYILDNDIKHNEKEITLGKETIKKQVYNGHDYFVGSQNVGRINKAIQNLSKETIKTFISFYKNYESTMKFICWITDTYNWNDKYKDDYINYRILYTEFIATIITKLIQGSTIKQIIDSDLEYSTSKKELKYINKDSFTISKYKRRDNELFNRSNPRHMDAIIVNTLFQVQNLIEFHVKKYIQDFYYRVNVIYKDLFEDENVTNFLDFSTIDDNKIKLIRAGISDTFAINIIVKERIFKRILDKEQIVLEDLLVIVIDKYGDEDPLYYAIKDAL